MSENICGKCPISDSCPILGNPYGLPDLVDFNDCWGWSCPSVGKPAAQRALRNHFNRKLEVKIDSSLVTLVRFGSVQKPTAFSFSPIQRAVDHRGDIYTCRFGGTFQKNGQNAYKLKGK